MPVLSKNSDYEKVACVVNGYTPEPPPEAEAWSIPFQEIWFVPRGYVEGMFAVKQLIPYCVVVTTDAKLLMYPRDHLSSESRLTGKLSIGFGGHMSLEDFSPQDDPDVRFKRGLQDSVLRELKEELVDDRGQDIEILNNMKITSLPLMDFVPNEPDVTFVDYVHLALTCLVELDVDSSKLKESDFLKLVSIDDILDQDYYERFELWSKVAFDLLAD